MSAVTESPRVDAIAGDFDRDGFVLLTGLLTDSEIDAMADGVEWAIATQGGHPWIKALTYEWSADRPIFLHLIQHPVVLGLATRRLGPDFHLIAAQCSRNTRDDCYAPGAMAWHQDHVFFPEESRRTPAVADNRYGFSAMWYVQDTPIEMGPTMLLRGSQGSAAFDEASAVGNAVFSDAIPAGSLLIFNHRTWHTGRPNGTDRPRDLITNAYGRPELEKVQLLTGQPDGSQRYVEPTALCESSPLLAQLLRNRA